VTSDPERREFRCQACGYGICVERLPLSCPLCRSQSWILVSTPDVSAMLMSAGQDQVAVFERI
jgi:Zn finger protein HypA/HybF involved in hydrogenase expression